MNGDRRWALAGIAAILIVASARSVMLAAGPGPATIDTGNWLAYADDLLGSGVRGGVAYPPLVPLLSRVAVDLVGPGTGVALLGFLATLVPALAVLGVLARAGAPGLGGLAGGIAAAAAPLGEVIAWGGFPQAIALGAAVISVAGLAGWLVAGSARDALLGAAGWAIAIWSSHLVAVPLAVSSVALAGFVIAARPERTVLVRAACGALIGLVASLPVIPAYLALATELSVGGGARRLDPADLERVLGVLWPAWLLALAVGPLAAAVLVRTRRRERGRLERTVLAVAALAAGWSAVLLATGQVRYLHDAAVLAPLGVGVGAAALAWVQTPRPFRIAGAGAGAALAVAGLLAFPAQVDRYRVVSEDTVTALGWLRDATRADAVVAVPDLGGAPLGWWVEGLARRRTVFASDLRWLVFRDERRRAAAAGRLFYGAAFASPATAARARAGGVDFILLPDRVPWANLGAGPPPPGWTVRFRAGAAIVLGPLPEAPR